jgi:hypothetical protein
MHRLAGVALDDDRAVTLSSLGGPCWAELTEREPHDARRTSDGCILGKDAANPRPDDTYYA